MIYTSSIEKRKNNFLITKVSAVIIEGEDKRLNL